MISVGRVPWERNVQMFQSCCHLICSCSYIFQNDSFKKNIRGTAFLITFCNRFSVLFYVDLCCFHLILSLKQRVQSIFSFQVYYCFCEVGGRNLAFFMCFKSAGKSLHMYKKEQCVGFLFEEAWKRKGVRGLFKVLSREDILLFCKQSLLQMYCNITPVHIE